MSMPAIHPTAIVDPAAELEAEVRIGPYAVIEGPVRLGSGTRVFSHAYICGSTTIGRNCEIHPFTSIGGVPQDYSFSGEESHTSIGDHTSVREYASIHRGSRAGSTTSVGSHCMIMAKAHIGHDCRIGDGVILTNGAECAGHVEIGDKALISAHVLIHQFVRIGRRAMCVGGSHAVHDVPPFFVTDYSGGVVKVNLIGLKRDGLPRERLEQIKQAFKILYHSKLPFALAVDRLRQQDQGPEVDELLRFIERPSRRGIAGRGHARRSAQDRTLRSEMADN